MDASDVSACLYRINKRGGFTSAALEERVDFGFAAFGVAPEMSSAVKTVFKPLYKQCRRADGIIQPAHSSLPISTLRITRRASSLMLI